MYFLKGGLKLSLPVPKENEMLGPEQWPDLFKTLRACARAILKGEQTRTGKVSKADADKLTEQLLRWALGMPPFHQRQFFTSKDRVLDYWKNLRQDSNAEVLAVRLLSSFPDSSGPDSASRLSR